MLGVVFYSVSLRLFNQAFLKETFITFESFVAWSFSGKNHPDHFSLRYRGLKIVNLTKLASGRGVVKENEAFFVDCFVNF